MFYQIYKNFLVFIIFLLITPLAYSSSESGEAYSERKMRLVSLFAGIGGNEQGLSYLVPKEMVDHVLACEREAYPVYHLMKNHSPKYISSDINLLAQDESFWDTFTEPADILFSGFPCQPYSRSTAGNPKIGSESVQNQRLIDSMLNVIERASPQFLILENVPEVKKHKTYLKIQKKLQEHYTIVNKILNSKDCGAYENRNRLFIIGIKKELIEKHPRRFDISIPTVKKAQRLEDIIPRSRAWGTQNGKATFQTESLVAKAFRAFSEGKIKPLVELKRDKNYDGLLRSKRGFLIYRDSLKGGLYAILPRERKSDEGYSWSLAKLKENQVMTPSQSSCAYSLSNSSIGTFVQGRLPVIAEIADSITTSNLLRMQGFPGNYLNSEPSSARHEAILKTLEETDQSGQRKFVKSVLSPERQAIANIVSPYSIKAILLSLADKFPTSCLGKMIKNNQGKKINPVDFPKESVSCEACFVSSEFKESYFHSLDSYKRKCLLLLRELSNNEIYEELAEEAFSTLNSEDSEEMPAFASPAFARPAFARPAFASPAFASPAAVLVAQRWEKNFKLLEKFKKEHGHTRVPRSLDSTVYPKFGRWVDRQRQSCRNEELLFERGFIRKGGHRISPERIARLKSLDFEWEPGKSKYKRVMGSVLPSEAASIAPTSVMASPADVLVAQRWEKNFKLLEKFKKEHGHTRVPRSLDSTEYPKQLGRWVDKQREGRRNEKLLMKTGSLRKGGHRISPERIARLEGLGFEWDPGKSKQKRLMRSALSSGAKRKRARKTS